jgi:biphenyl-4-hydroxylase
MIYVNSPYDSDVARGADVITFLVAGHDTTAYTLSWILIEVARHPIVLTKLQQELDDIVRNGFWFTPSTLGNLEYLNMVIKEGMRLWPVGTFIRESLVDIAYKGKVIPKGNFRKQLQQTRLLKCITY